MEACWENVQSVANRLGEYMFTWSGALKYALIGALIGGGGAALLALLLR